MKIAQFEFNLFGENTYVIWNEESHQAAIVDPGMDCKAEVDAILQFISNKQLSPEYILLTHAHIDHTMGVEAIKETFPNIKILCHRADMPLAQARSQQAAMFRLRINPGPLEIDSFIADNDEIMLVDEKIIVMFTPGHTPGGVCYYVPDSHFVLTGDTLFLGSVGRTDLPGGNHTQLINSIVSELMSLPANTKVYPGHGSSTTIGTEMRSNPFIR